MKYNDETIDALIEYLAGYLAGYYADEHHISLNKAYEIVTSSPAYRQLSNKNTMLYADSPAAIYAEI